MYCWLKEHRILLHRVSDQLLPSPKPNGPLLSLLWSLYLLVDGAALPNLLDSFLISSSTPTTRLVRDWTRPVQPDHAAESFHASRGMP